MRASATEHQMRALVAALGRASVWDMSGCVYHPPVDPELRAVYFVARARYLAKYSRGRYGRPGYLNKAARAAGIQTSSYADHLRRLSVSYSTLV